jgi:uncharacterized protein
LSHPTARTMHKNPSINALVLGLALTACTEHTDPGTRPEHDQAHPEHTHMKNLVSIVEVPTADLRRAMAFYQAILGTTLEEVDMGTSRLGVFPSEEGTVGLVLVNGEGYVPSADGTVAYLNAGTDLQVVLDRVGPSGGKVIVTKTEVSPEMGYFALFTDTEGNRLGLHSTR